MVVNLFLKLGTQLGGPSLFYKLWDSAGRTEPILGTMGTQLRRTEPILRARGYSAGQYPLAPETRGLRKYLKIDAKAD